MDETWIVVIDRPYYPEVDEFATLDEAAAHFDRMVVEENDGDPDDPKSHTTYVYLARVEDRQCIYTTH